MGVSEWWNIGGVTKAAEEAALKGAQRFMEAVITAAIDEAPVDTGTLRRSATVTVGGLPSVPAGSALVGSLASGKTMGSEKAVYGSFSTPYAIVQHEHWEYQHPRGGGPKYLQKPWDMMKGKATEYVQDFVEEALGE